MRLENILDLTRGSLQNEPFITAFESVSYRASRVKRGDLFIALAPETIEEALFNGAYGIIFDKPTQISDDEIAWIKVDSIEDAMLRLLRFRLIDKELDVYECDRVTLALASQLLTTHQLIVLGDDFLDTFKRLWDCEPGSTVLFNGTLTNKALFTSTSMIPDSPMQGMRIIEQTLFESAYIHRHTFYERQRISPFFLSYLSSLLEFLESKRLRFRIRTFGPLGHFEPLFVNAALEIKEFGGSDKVLIFEPDLSLVDEEAEFLKQNASWANVIVLRPLDGPGDVLTVTDTFTYADEADIIRTLKRADFHFALIAGQRPDLLDRHQTSKQQVQLAFDL